MVSLTQEAEEKNLLLEQKQRTIEFASFSDGKEGIAKAANYLCSKYLKFASSKEDNGTPVFTEANMSLALGACGSFSCPHLLDGPHIASIIYNFYGR